MSANPHANGGLLRKPLELPDFREYAVTVTSPATSEALPTEVLAQFLRDVMRGNMTNFRVFGPDETASNRLQAIYEASKKTWLADYLPEDADGGELAVDGRVMEMLSEHDARRLARRLSADRTTRLLFEVRSVRAHHRLDVQPAR